jgi:hypothetical protein
MFGTDESEFIRILCSRSYPQLVATFNEYSKLSNKDIEKAIKSEMSGDLERACLAIVKIARNKFGYFAELIHDAIHGFTSKDENLIRLIVTKSEVCFSIFKGFLLEQYLRMTKIHFNSNEISKYRTISNLDG